MRLFIAVNFDEQTKSHLLAIEQRLKELSPFAGFTAPDNLHLTLAFLGEIEKNDLPPIYQAIDQVSFTKTQLCFNHMGQFYRDEGNICWIGADENKELLTARTNLIKNLNEVGFFIENVPFKSHVTLARRAHLPANVNLRNFLSSPFFADIETIDLMKSERIGRKLVYTKIYPKP